MPAFDDEDLSPEDMAAIDKMKAATTPDAHGRFPNDGERDFAGAMVTGTNISPDGATIIDVQLKDGTTVQATVIEAEPAVPEMPV